TNWRSAPPKSSARVSSTMCKPACRARYADGRGSAALDIWTPKGSPADNADRSRAILLVKHDSHPGKGDRTSDYRAQSGENTIVRGAGQILRGLVRRLPDAVHRTDGYRATPLMIPLQPI